MTSPTEVHFVITKGRVSFYEFARFFRDSLGCRNALFLDGGVAPGLCGQSVGRNDAPGHGGYGPISQWWTRAMSEICPVRSLIHLWVRIDWTVLQFFLRCKFLYHPQLTLWRRRMELQNCAIHEQRDDLPSAGLNSSNLSAN